MKYTFQNGEAHYDTVTQELLGITESPMDDALFMGAAIRALEKQGEIVGDMQLEAAAEIDSGHRRFQVPEQLMAENQKLRLLAAIAREATTQAFRSLTPEEIVTR